MLRARLPPPLLLPTRAPAILVALAVLVAHVPGPAAAADEDEPGSLVLPGSGREVPLYVVEGDIFILQDRDWCENLIALTEEERDPDGLMPADPARVDRCQGFLARLADNDVALLPRSLAAQLVALPDELLVPGPTDVPSRSPDPVHEPETVPGPHMGRGEGRSETFLLAGGDYEALVEVDPDCEFFAAFLTEATSKVAVVDIEGDARLDDVPASMYYWDVLAPDCAWSIALHPG